MFGYITINQDELKGKDLNVYQAYYCGICQDLKEIGGQRARWTLTYDMTFLAILLSGLYEGEETESDVFCIAHPFHKKHCIRNAYTKYAAEMNLLLVYHNLMDDWLDDKKIMSLASARFLQRSYHLIAEKYPRQRKAVEDYLIGLHKAEEENAKDIDLAAGLTGHLMREIFLVKEDEWKRELGQVGFFIGKFIYLMDAYEDMEKDKEKGSYNPFLHYEDEKHGKEWQRQVLEMMASGAAAGFERLPILKNVDILRNILYVGIWAKYAALQQKNDEKTIGEQNAGSL